jgi:hypothetical protein
MFDGNRRKSTRSGTSIIDLRRSNLNSGRVISVISELLEIPVLAFFEEYSVTWPISTSDALIQTDKTAVLDITRISWKPDTKEIDVTSTRVGIALGYRLSNAIEAI